MDEQALTSMFDAALVHRDRGEYDESLGKLEELTRLLSTLPKDARRSKQLLCHAHMQIGYICGIRGDTQRQEQNFRLACGVAPRLELASLGLFHSLWNLGRNEEALQEAVRYVSLKDSDGYRELLADGFGSDLSETQERLAIEARQLLARHRA